MKRCKSLFICALAAFFASADGSDTRGSGIAPYG
jgi:hypothetical protein